MVYKSDSALQSYAQIRKAQRPATKAKTPVILPTPNFRVRKICRLPPGIKFTHDTQHYHLNWAVGVTRTDSWRSFTFIVQMT